MLHRELARADVLLTSFRPSALEKLQIGWKKLHRLYPRSARWPSWAPQATGPRSPATTSPTWPTTAWSAGWTCRPQLYADMGGSLMASEAVLSAALMRSERYAGTGDVHPRGVFMEVALADAAGYLALPRAWSDPAYRLGRRRPRGLPRVPARTAGSPWRRWAALCSGPVRAAGLGTSDIRTMLAPATREAIAAFLKTRTRKQLDALAVQRTSPAYPGGVARPPTWQNRGFDQLSIP